MIVVNPIAVDEALANADLVKQLIDEVAAGSQLAAKVHRSLLPSPVRHPQIDVDVRYLPVDNVSGNYCQVRFPVPTICYITICEVRGHGITPSLLATRVSSEVKHFISDRLRPMAIVRELNEFIYENFQDVNVSLSFIAAQIDLDHRTISYSGAGHPGVLLLPSEGGRVCSLDSQNSLIGVSESCLSEEPEHTRALAEGDRLLFYTSGLLRAADAEGRPFGQAGLEQIASDVLSVGTFAMADLILEEVARFRNGRPKTDKTLIVAEIK